MLWIVLDGNVKTLTYLNEQKILKKLFKVISGNQALLM